MTAVNNSNKFLGASYTEIIFYFTKSTLNFDEYFDFVNEFRALTNRVVGF